MTHLILDLFRRLDGLRPGADESQLTQELGDWSHRGSAAAIRYALYDWIASAISLDNLTAGARETSTHYVWPLYSAATGHSVVINEFKGRTQLTSGYANTVHNHRYSFASLVLAGGYSHVRYQVETSWPGLADRIYETTRENVNECSLTMVNHEDFHQITELQDRTLTLLMKCPAAKATSTSVNLDTMVMHGHIPAEARVQQLMSALVEACDGREIAEVQNSARSA